MSNVQFSLHTRSQDAVIRVYDEAANVIETHERTGISKSREVFIRIMRCHRRSTCDSECILQKRASNRMIYLSVERLRRERECSPEKPEALALTLGASDRRPSNAM